MIRTIDPEKIDAVRAMVDSYANPATLRREGNVFLIGADLPVFSTLETMYESYCLESSELFHVTFGSPEQLEHNLEMVRQIKRNFSIRLMGRVEYPLSGPLLERLYLAGLDVIDIPASVNNSMTPDGILKQSALASAVATFKRWSVVSTISTKERDLQVIRNWIDQLLSGGIVPLLDITGDVGGRNTGELKGLFEFLAAEWHKRHVPLKPIMPLLKLTTPFIFNTPSGFIRNVIDKIQDRHILATSDLRRHLRTSGAEASFESAGL